MKKLSILIPAYNVENYIEECINSVLDLNINYEIIIINDGSTDNTKKILKQYKTYNYIKIINQDNMGISITRNNLLKEAKGQYIFFLDSDDYINKEKFKELIKKVNNQDLIMFNYNIFNNKKIKKNRFKNKYQYINKDKDKLYKLISRRNDLYLWTFLIKRDLILKKDIKFFPHLFEDLKFLLEIIYYSEKIEFINLDVINYRVNRKNQLTKIHSYQSISDRIIMSDLTIKQIEKFKINSKLKKKLYARVANLYYSAIPLINRKSNEEKELLIKLVNEYSYILKYTSYKTFLLHNLLKINKKASLNISCYIVKTFKLY